MSKVTFAASPPPSETSSTDSWSDLEKRHCCCCIRLPEGAALVGMYGLALHTGLLVVQATHGRSAWLWGAEGHGWGFDNEYGALVVGPLVMVGHVVGIIVNALLGRLDRARSLLQSHSKIVHPFVFAIAFVVAFDALLVAVAVVLTSYCCCCGSCFCCCCC